MTTSYTALVRNDLYSLEKYAEIRKDFKKTIMQHKANRRLPLGANVMLYFEDRMTMHYQIQEMLRAEKIFDAAGIEEELSAYNPLIPSGENLKATMMVQYTDVDERAAALARLIGIEKLIWLDVEGHDHVYPICDEDLERDTNQKTSAVHFLRFEFSNEMIHDLRTGKSILAGVEHPEYIVKAKPVAPNITSALAEDFK